MKSVETVTLVHFKDDVDGKEQETGQSAGTIKFVNQAGYLREIDLVGEKYDELFSMLDALEQHSRASDVDSLKRGRPRKAGSSASSGSAPKSGKRAETAAIRQWATDNGIAISGSGRLPGGVREQWEAAGRPGLPASEDASE